MNEKDNIIKKDNFGFILDGYNLSIVKNNNGFMFYDIKEQKLFLEHVFADVNIENFSEGMLPIAEKKGEKIVWGYVNVQDKSIINPRYKEVCAFSGGYALVRSFRDMESDKYKNYNMGVINKNGYEVIASKYVLYGNINDDILVGFELCRSYSSVRERLEYYENSHFLDKKYHKWPAYTGGRVVYLQSNKFGNQSTFNGRMYEKQIFTCYLFDDYLVVEKDYWYSHKRLSEQVEYTVYGLNGEVIMRSIFDSSGVSINKNEMPYQGYIEVDNLIKSRKKVKKFSKYNV